MTFIHAPTQEMTDDSSAKITYIPLECRTMVYLGKQLILIVSMLLALSRPSKVTATGTHQVNNPIGRVNVMRPPYIVRFSAPDYCK